MGLSQPKRWVSSLLVAILSTALKKGRRVKRMRKNKTCVSINQMESSSKINKRQIFF